MSVIGTIELSFNQDGYCRQDETLGLNIGHITERLTRKQIEVSGGTYYADGTFYDMDCNSFIARVVPTARKTIKYKLTERKKLEALEENGLNMRDVEQHLSGEQESKGPDRIELLPKYVKKFLCSSSFGGVYEPMVVSGDSPLCKDPHVDLVIDTASKKKTTIPQTLSSKMDSAKVIIKKGKKKGSFLIIQEIVLTPQLFGTQLDRNLCRTKITLSGTGEDYELKRITQKIIPIFSGDKT